jgi:hypothetical protein
MNAQLKQVMKRALLTLLALLCLMASASAKIGETYSQVYNEARRDKDTRKMQIDRSEEGRLQLRVFYRNGDLITHEFDANAREVGFYWQTAHRITESEIGKIQRIFRTRWHGVYSHPNWKTWNSESGLVMGTKDDFLVVEVRNAFPANSPAPTPPPTIDFQPLTSNDCLIVATEAYGRLSKSAYWTRIGGFNILKDENLVNGHAVVFYQPTPGSNVWMYDASGSFDLRTKSHDLTVIAGAVNALLKQNVRISDAEWVDPFTSATTNN